MGLVQERTGAAVVGGVLRRERAAAVARRQGLSVHHGYEIDAAVPRGVRRQLDLEGDAAALAPGRRRRIREPDDQATPQVRRPRFALVIVAMTRLIGGAQLPLTMTFDPG